MDIQLQQNSFNLTSDNVEILIIWRLKRVVRRPKVLLFSITVCILIPCYIGVSGCYIASTYILSKRDTFKFS